MGLPALQIIPGAAKGETTQPILRVIDGGRVDPLPKNRVKGKNCSDPTFIRVVSDLSAEPRWGKRLRLVEDREGVTRCANNDTTPSNQGSPQQVAQSGNQAAGANANSFGGQEPPDYNNPNRHYRELESGVVASKRTSAGNDICIDPSDVDNVLAPHGYVDPLDGGKSVALPEDVAIAKETEALEIREPSAPGGNSVSQASTGAVGVLTVIAIAEPSFIGELLLVAGAAFASAVATDAVVNGEDSWLLRDSKPEPIKMAHRKNKRKSNWDKHTKRRPGSKEKKQKNPDWRSNPNKRKR